MRSAEFLRTAGAIRRCRQRLVHFPPKSKASPDRGALDTRSLGPFRDTQGLPSVGQSSIRALIASLGRVRGPSAVVGAVALRVLDAVHAVLRPWALAHVGEETFEGIPARSNRQVLIARLALHATAHRQPAAVRAVQSPISGAGAPTGAAVTGGGCATWLATATPSGAPAQAAGCRSHRGAAVALAYPDAPLVHAVGVESGDGEISEALTDQGEAGRPVFRDRVASATQRGARLQVPADDDLLGPTVTSAEPSSASVTIDVGDFQGDQAPEAPTGQVRCGHVPYAYHFRRARVPRRRQRLSAGQVAA